MCGKKENDLLRSVDYELDKRKSFRKRAAARIFMVLAVVPLLYSIFLMKKIDYLEKQVETLKSEKERQYQKTMAANENGEANALSGAMKEAQKSFGKKADSDSVETGKKSADSGEKDNISISPKVYLTFDDGPSKNTDEILDILKQEGVKATFFVIGKTDQQSLKQMKRMVDEGHSIGIHSYTHDYSRIYRSLEDFKKDVTKMDELIYKATGVRTRLYRFPGGSSNTVSSIPIKECIHFLNQNGYIYYDWNALNGDAVSKELPVETLIDNIMVNVKQNKESIVLMHDLVNRYTTVQSLKPLITRLKKEGYVMEKIEEDTVPVQQVTNDKKTE